MVASLRRFIKKFKKNLMKMRTYYTYTKTLWNNELPPLQHPLVPCNWSFTTHSNTPTKWPKKEKLFKCHSTHLALYWPSGSKYSFPYSHCGKSMSPTLFFCLKLIFFVQLPYRIVDYPASTIHFQLLFKIWEGKRKKKRRKKNLFTKYKDEWLFRMWLLGKCGLLCSWNSNRIIGCVVYVKKSMRGTWCKGILQLEHTREQGIIEQFVWEMTDSFQMWWHTINY